MDDEEDDQDDSVELGSKRVRLKVRAHASTSHISQADPAQEYFFLSVRYPSSIQYTLFILILNVA